MKTLRFANPKYVGDPINAVRIFNDKEADELMVLDIAATRENTGPAYALIEQFAGECFMPLCYGGGIRTTAEARRLISLGVEKVCVQTAALDDLSVVTSMADSLGSQGVVVSVDVKRDWIRRPQLYRSAAGTTERRNRIEYVRAVADAGAGEIVLNAVDRDGTMQGMDLAMIGEACAAVSVPVIALGGVGSLDDIKAAADAGASGVAAGAFFVFVGRARAVLMTYPSYKDLEGNLITERSTVTKSALAASWTRAPRIFPSMTKASATTAGISCRVRIGCSRKTALQREEQLDAFVARVKHQGAGNRYDCVIGVSGGVDSSWALVQAVKVGLRPLAVHMDNGWNSELAQNDIANLVRALGVDLHTHVIDWEEYRALMQAFFDADVIDVELLYDNAMLAVNYRSAAAHGVKSILA